MKRASRKYRDRGVEIISVSLDKDKQKFKTFARRQKMSWVHVMEGGGWGTRVIPAMLRWHRDEGKVRVETSICSHNIPVFNLYVKLRWRFPAPHVSFHRHARNGHPVPPSAAPTNFSTPA